MYEKMIFNLIDLILIDSIFFILFNNKDEKFKFNIFIYL